MLSKPVKKLLLDMGLPLDTIEALENNNITNAQIRRFIKTNPEWLKNMIPIIKDQCLPENKDRKLVVIESNTK